MLISIPGGPKIYGKQCYNHCVETEAPTQGASIVQASGNNFKQAVFLSNILSVPQAYQNNELPNLSRAQQEVAATRMVILQQILTRCEVSGIHGANVLAKEYTDPETASSTRAATQMPLYRATGIARPRANISTLNHQVYHHTTTKTAAAAAAPLTNYVQTPKYADISWKNVNLHVSS